jgi:DNA-binding transcriptional LysR family regulator
MLDRLNLEGLRYAQAVAETKSFSAAARAYGVTQPALSNGIAKLEERLGEKLFDRSPRGVARTSFGARILPLIDSALSGIDAIAAEAHRLAGADQQEIRMGVSPLISRALVARAFNGVCELPNPKDLVLREANMEELREGLLASDLDIILIPAVAPLPRFEHRIIDVEPLVVLDPGSSDGAPLELCDAGGDQFILVPDTCGLTRFTADLFKSHEMPLRSYPGEAASYRVLEEWVNLGLGSAILPQSKLTSPDTPHRPLMDEGREVEIFYEAVWKADSPMGADLLVLADGLAASTK